MGGVALWGSRLLFVPSQKSPEVLSDLVMVAMVVHVQDNLRFVIGFRPQAPGRWTPLRSRPRFSWSALVLRGGAPLDPFPEGTIGVIIVLFTEWDGVHFPFGR